jgi:hypothetical protein
MQLTDYYGATTDYYVIRIRSFGVALQPHSSHCYFVLAIGQAMFFDRVVLLHNSNNNNV